MQLKNKPLNNLFFILEGTIVFEFLWALIQCIYLQELENYKTYITSLLDNAYQALHNDLTAIALHNRQ